jgi:hypothetical protein
MLLKVGPRKDKGTIDVGSSLRASSLSGGLGARKISALDSAPQWEGQGTGNLALDSQGSLCMDPV